MRKHAFKHSEKPSKVQQQFKDNCDINRIMDRARHTGQIPMTGRQPLNMGGDFEVPSIDFMYAQNLVIDTRRAFDALPAKIRKEFNNDPYQLVRAVEDPNMREKLIELGVLNKPPVPVTEPPIKSDPEANPGKKVSDAE